MSDTAVPAKAAAVGRVDRTLIASLAVVVVVAAGLVIGARAGSAALLGAVAGAQALLAFAYVFGTVLPGRWGALVLAVAAAVAADVCVSVWPDGRLGVLAGVLGLAVPVMFVHQLSRGAARVRLVASMSATAALLFGVVSLPALAQTRHEFVNGDQGGRVVAGAVLVTAAALAAGYLVDLVAPTPRVDPAVARGVPALAASTLVGGLVGFAVLRGSDGYPDGRGLFVGLVLGAAGALLALVAAFAGADAAVPSTRIGRWLRPVLTALLPVATSAPLTFLVCLAIRA